MQLTVAAVGQRMPPWVQEAWRDYARRLPRELTLELREIPLGRRGRNAPVDKLRAAEGAALLAAVPQDHRVIALDERGRQWSTQDLADRLQGWMREEHGVGFLIGGPDGLSQDCRRLARDTWALGRLTLPHPLVRVILAEQLYRAWSITRNHPYHRA
jgi:23S rRNA (pseudouridine1915-N3)-methyltransferase